MSQYDPKSTGSRNSHWGQGCPIAVPPRKILVADRDPGILLLIPRILSSWKSTFVVTSDASRILPLAAEQLPQLILLDCHFPGKSGPELARRIRSNPKTSAAKIVIFSTDTDEQIDPKNLSACDGWITKPFEVGTLGKTLVGIIQGNP